jgi:MFS family permease
MREFLELLRRNRNYRNMWMGQVVSEIGDNFNNIAVFALAMSLTHSGLVIMGIMLSRAIPAITIGPLAGVLLDRFDRKKIMIASDLTRAFVALGFILAYREQKVWLLYTFSALLMVASPFFTAGRSAILPTIADEKEIHTANSLTQTTQWTNLTIGTFLGATVIGIGYEWAFIFNAISFLLSAWAILKLHPPEGKQFRAEHRDLTEAEVIRPWHEYREGLRYMRSVPLVFAIAMLAVGPREAELRKFYLRCLVKWCSIAEPPGSGPFGDAPDWVSFLAVQLPTGSGREFPSSSIRWSSSSTTLSTAEHTFCSAACSSFNWRLYLSLSRAQP